MLVALVFSGAATAETSDVETTWRLLDYIAVDYAGAVSHGAVSRPSEYAEQSEFAATVAAKLAALPPKPERPALATEAARLQRAIEDKADPEQVASIAHSLAAALLAAYPVPLAPNKLPDVARGATLYGQSCAACHGEAGDGHGPDAAKLDTPPIAFTDVERARQRSVFALYQVITQGLDGTAMPSFDSLPTDDRWALAFYAGQFAFPDSAAAEGERLWKQDISLRRLVPDLKTLVGTTPAALASRIGQDKADSVIAYLRRHPDAVTQQQGGSLSLVRGRLKESLEAYRKGDRQRAGELALSAYLDGFEPIEPVLAARDRTLMERIEGAMGDYRAAIQAGASADALANRLQVLDDLFDDAEASLSPDAASGLSTFLGSATILLREGLEALLIVVAMIAFLRKAERVEVMPYVHAGWVGALITGFLTWVVATWVVGISGASRELTEGFGSLFAAVVLLSVGIWMHGKAQADQWQHYIHKKMAKALSGSPAWLLFGLAFVVVYREVFETILFYAALWTQGNGGTILAGALSACAALAVIAWAMLRYSSRLPISKFFTYSSWLMAALTVVLAGKGIAALQEAGVVGIAPLGSVPRISLVGLFPTAQTVAAQVLMIAALAVGFVLNRRGAARGENRVRTPSA
jgi:high-affinity iron transporter